MVNIVNMWANQNEIKSGLLFELAQYRLMLTWMPWMHSLSNAPLTPLNSTNKHKNTHHGELMTLAKNDFNLILQTKRQISTEH